MSLEALASSATDTTHAGSPDAIVQLLIASRRTLEQARVLASQTTDAATVEQITRAGNAIGRAMDQRILGGHR